MTEEPEWLTQRWLDESLVKDPERAEALSALRERIRARDRASEGPQGPYGTIQVVLTPSWERELCRWLAEQDCRLVPMETGEGERPTFTIVRNDVTMRPPPVL